MDYIIGMDVGTTATKGVLYQEDGEAIKELSQPYPLIQEENNQAEEDPDLLFDAAQKIIFTLSEFAQGSIKAIAWSSQMHSLIGLNKKGQLLTRSITWADNRSSSVVEEAKKSGLAKAIYQKTGMPAHPMAPVYKILWIKKAYPELFAQVDKWIGIKEYLIWRLTGELKVDTTMAAGTGLLNAEGLEWDAEILDEIGIKASQLPQIAMPSSLTGPILEEYQKKLNLDSETKITLGASDGYLSTIGVGVTDDKFLALNVGTSGAVRVISSRKCIDEKQRFFCYAVDREHYLIGGPVNNGGIVFEWARKTILGPNEDVEDYLSTAETAPVGSNGLIFHPYLGGERAPIWDAQARGSFVGLTRQHTKPQLARSVIEGIVLNLREAAEGLLNNIEKPQAIKVTGGFVKSDFVRQMIADIFNLPVVAIQNNQSGTLAAMWLAKKGLEDPDIVEKASQKLQKSKTYFPNPKHVQVYQELIPIYREVGEALNKSYQNIANFQKRYPQTFR